MGPLGSFPRSPQPQPLTLIVPVGRQGPPSQQPGEPPKNRKQPVPMCVGVAGWLACLFVCLLGLAWFGGFGLVWFGLVWIGLVGFIALSFCGHVWFCVAVRRWQCVACVFSQTPPETGTKGAAEQTNVLLISNHPSYATSLGSDQEVFYSDGSCLLTRTLDV